MPRTINEARLETRAARARLPPDSRKVHFKTLIPGGLHLGYRRKAKEQAGTWHVRSYRGDERYNLTLLGTADDLRNADNVAILTFEEAQRRALLSRKPHEAPKPLTVAECVADYLRFLEAERKTAEDARLRAEKLILPALGKATVCDLTTPQILRWRDGLAAEPALLRTKEGEVQKFKQGSRSRATVNRTLTILKAALNRAFALGLVEDDTAWRRAKPFSDTFAARPGYLSTAEGAGLIDAADPSSGFRDLVHGALQTGCRYGELCSMQVRDFDPDRGKLSIPKSKSGKGRTIVLTEEGVSLFAGLTVARPPGDPIFLRASGRPWSKSQQDRYMREACDKAGINPPVGFHAFRHTWASHAVMNGMPLMVIARNLGHASTAMVEKHYGHLAETYVDAAVRRDAPRFGRAETITS